SGRDVLKRSVPILPLVRPTRRPTSHHQIPFGDLELNGKMVVGEGGAQMGDEVFDRFKTKLIFRRPSNVCRIVVVENNGGSNQLVNNSDISRIQRLFIQPASNGFVVFS